MHPIANFFKKLSPAECKYDVKNLDLLVVKLVLKQWRHWLEGTLQHLFVLTDRKNLEYLLKAKILNPRQTFWCFFFFYQI